MEVALPTLTLGVFDFFHHAQPVSVVTDFEPALHDNGNLIGTGRSVSVSQDTPLALRKLFQRSLTTVIRGDGGVGPQPKSRKVYDVELSPYSGIFYK